MSSARLERSTTNRVISGVCGGIADYLAIDSTLIRVFFVLAGIFTGGLFVIAYVALMFVMPLPGRPVTGIAASAGSTASEVADSLRRAADDITQSFRREPNTATGAAPGEPAATEPSVVDHVGRAKETDRRRAAFGYLLILVGVVFLLGNTGIFRAIQWQLVWPLVLVGIGILLLVQRVRQ